MRVFAAFWLGVMAVLVMGAAYQLSPVDVEQNTRLDSLEIWRVTLDTPPQYADATITPTLLPTATQELEIVASVTATSNQNEISVQALVTLWIRPEPHLSANARVFRSQWLRLDMSQCVAANGAVYARVLNIDLVPASGWVAVRAGNTNYVSPFVVCEK